MKYNPKIHHRKSIRLKGYDYSKSGAYFITICCQNRKCRFGEIIVGASLADAPVETDAQMNLNEYGQIAYDEWVKLPERFSNFELDVFQIMPNHMQGIILLNPVRTTFTVAPTEFNETNSNNIQPAKPESINGQSQLIDGQPQGIAPTGIAPTTIGDIAGAYKSQGFSNNKQSSD